MTTGPVVQAQSILEHSSYSPKEKALLVVVDVRMIVKYGFTRSLGALRDPTSSLGPFGPV